MKAAYEYGGSAFTGMNLAICFRVMRVSGDAHQSQLRPPRLLKHDPRRILVPHPQSRPAAMLAEKSLLAGKEPEDPLEHRRANPPNAHRSASLAHHDHLATAVGPCARSIITMTRFGDAGVRFGSMIDIT